MIAALNLVHDLRRQGVTFHWRPKKGLFARGELGRLTLDYREALAKHRPELEVLAQWETLQDESEARFGGPEARLYPFLRLDMKNAPYVRTERGEAKVVRAMPTGADVVFRSELDRWDQACLDAEKILPCPSMTRLGIEQVYPPRTPPEVL